MKTLVNYSLLLAIISFTIVGCKKYENGPDFSIIPKKERISNNWKLASYSENGVDKTSIFNSLFQNAMLQIESDGDYVLTYKAAGLVDYSEKGTWRFVNNKKDFETNPTSGNGSVVVHHILRLKETELWYYEEDNGVRKEYHLIP